MPNELLEKFIEIIEESQEIIESVIELITPEEKENNTLNYLEQKASNIINKFSNNYDIITKSLPLTDEINKTIKYFIGCSNDLIKTSSYYVFFKFSSIELQCIIELLNEEYPDEGSVYFV